MTTETILPCPFCGASRGVVGLSGASVICHGCLSSGPAAPENEEAIVLWNRGSSANHEIERLKQDNARLKAELANALSQRSVDAYEVDAPAMPWADPAEEVSPKYAFYSESMAAMSGTVIWENASGDRIEATGVYDDKYAASLGWEDKKFVGEVVKWVAFGRKSLP